MQAFQLEVHETQSALVTRGIQLWQQAAAVAIAERGSFTVALAGGSTPKQLYSALATTAGLEWSRTMVFWGDERYVPHDHPDSNYLMARQTLLDHVPIPPENVYPWPTDAGDPATDSQRYRVSMSRIFPGEWPIFDLILLGIGGDGHTASLFPGSAALAVTDQWTAVGEKSGEPRLTLTFPVLNQGRQVIFFVAGEGKAAIMQEVLTTDPQYPSQQVHPQGSLLWLLDAPAAAQLPLKVGL